MSDDTKQDAAKPRDLTITAIELGRASALGRDVRLELRPEITILVGRNGAGKSAILECIDAALDYVTGVVTTPPSLARVACELRYQEQNLRYECAWTDNSDEFDEFDERDQIRVSTVEERCTIESPVRRTLWQVRGGKISVADDGVVREMPPRVTLLQWLPEKDAKAVAPALALLLRHTLKETSHVRPERLREPTARRELVIPMKFGRWLRSPDNAARRELGRIVFALFVLPDERRQELIGIGQRISAFQQIDVKRYLDPDAYSESPNHFISVSVDGVDLGLLSDGMLRVLQILLALTSDRTRLLLIDEPESAVHPGLLGKLLHEIEAYSTDRQIVISTHSPQVVSWAKPEAIRVVTRTDGATHVRGLGDKTIRHLEKYLHDEDTLGEFVYGGGLDGFEE